MVVPKNFACLIQTVGGPIVSRKIIIEGQTMYPDEAH